VTVTIARPRQRAAVRDPQRTRERIIAAALKEFAARGFAGARVDRIALRARVNKRMLYHYFGNKEDLFRAILRLKVSDRAWADRAPGDPGALLQYWFHLASENMDWLRLVQWEALRVGSGPVIAETERRESFERGVATLRDRQREGVLAGDLDAREMLLAMIAVTAFPLAFPQITRLVTGLPPADPGFQASHTKFLTRVADAFRSPAPPRVAGMRPEGWTVAASRGTIKRRARANGVAAPGLTKTRATEAHQG
jgi:TetR/AcrR family transcriptional regulator